MPRLRFVSAFRRACCALSQHAGALRRWAPRRRVARPAPREERGARASPTSGNAANVAGLVRLPFGVSAESLGLAPVVPGFGRIRRRRCDHELLPRAPGALLVEVAAAAPHPPRSSRGLDRRDARAPGRRETAKGRSSAGVADTGLDVTHADFLAADGSSRVAWLLDLSAPPFRLEPGPREEVRRPRRERKLRSARCTKGATFRSPKRSGSRSRATTWGTGRT